MATVSLDNLSRFYDTLALSLAMHTKDIVLNGLCVAVDRGYAASDVNDAADAWQAKGYLSQDDVDAIAAYAEAHAQTETEPTESTGDSDGTETTEP